ncbi:MAG TPA: mycoredoxin [Mycobacteriales bacterium]|jgi:mycoredoxin|nr:mycoredoxin [Mycobacteriales bacterium]
MTTDQEAHVPADSSPTPGPGVTSSPMTIYSTPWCGYCHRLMKQLDREGVSYDVVDIEQVPSAAEYVMSVNGGNQTVPTVVFADGTAMTNPSLAQVKARLAA